ncbi:MAG: hypothetical protein A2231_08910 [Candidatus Firestonebacteria bacterium RIFOXYA2_FULL_40_8]|nr:MAG: hypothetical protein A2231_08910 [Candidatus Firestonebacteria bacterium RIFOXYA2_FULL_40_8]
MLVGQSKEWDAIYNEVKRVKGKFTLKNFIIRTGICLGITTAAYFLLIAAYHIFSFSPATSFEMLLILLLVLLAGLIVSFQTVLFPMSDKDIVLIIEKKYPEIKDQLACSLELACKPSDEIMKNWYLFDAIWKNTSLQLSNVSFSELINPKLLKLGYLSILGAVIITLMGTLFLPGFVISAGTGFITKVNSFKVIPGDLTVAAGSNIEVKVMCYFKPQKEPVLKFKNNSKNFQEIQMNRKGDNLYEELFSNATEDILYYCVVDDVKSKEYKIKVINPPKIETVKTVLKYPSYIKQKEKILTAIEDISELKNTEASIRITLNKEIDKCDFTSAGNDYNFKLYKKEFVLNFKIREDSECIFKFIDKDGLSSELYKFNIKAIEDNPPVVNVFKPKDKNEVKKTEEIEIEASAEDDYGVDKMGLSLSINGEPEKKFTVNFEKEEAAKGRFTYTLKLADLKVEYGDIIAYFAYALDNCPTQNEGKSEIHFIEISEHDTMEQEAGEGKGVMVDALKKLINQERKIIKNTFSSANKLERKRDKETLAEITKIAESQLKTRVFAEKFYNSIKLKLFDIAVLVDKAVEQMKAAEGLLNNCEPKKAMSPPEQKALAYLEQAYKDAIKLKLLNPKSSDSDEEDDTETETTKDQEKKDMEKALEELAKEQKDFSEKEKKDEAKQLEDAIDKLQDILKDQQNLNNEAQAKAGKSKGSSGAPKEGKSGEVSGKELEQKQKENLEKAKELKIKTMGGNEKNEEAKAAMGGAASDFSKEDFKEGEKKGKEALDKLQEMKEDLMKMEKAERGTGTKEALDDLVKKQQEINKTAKEMAGGFGEKEKDNNKDLSFGQEGLAKKTGNVKVPENEAKNAVSSAKELMKSAAGEYSKDDVKEGVGKGNKAAAKLKEAIASLKKSQEQSNTMQEAIKDMMIKMQEAKNDIKNLKDKPDPKSEKETAQKMKENGKNIGKAKEMLGKKEKMGGGTEGKGAAGEKESELGDLTAIRNNKQMYLSVIGDVLDALEKKYIELEGEEANRNIDKQKVPSVYKKLVEKYYEDLSKDKK